MPLIDSLLYISCLTRPYAYVLYDEINDVPLMLMELPQRAVRPILDVPSFRHNDQQTAVSGIKICNIAG